MTGDNLLNLFLIRSCSSFRGSITDTSMCKSHRIDDNFIEILTIQVSIYLLRALLIRTPVPGTFWVFMWSSKAKLVLYRGFTNYFEEIVEREEVIAFDWKLTELMK